MSVIKDNSEVLMHFAIKLDDGSVAESTYAAGKPAMFRMGDGSLTDNFEKCLLGLTIGEKVHLNYHQKMHLVYLTPIISTTLI